MDLGVWMPLRKRATEETPAKLIVNELLDRLDQSGYTHVALTHTIYGSPGPHDSAELLEEYVKRETATNIKVVKRLHAVVENLSDVGLYMIKGAGEIRDPTATKAALTKEQQVQDLFNQYDLVSISPRTEAAFQAACVSATAAEIITLDYTTAGGGRSGGTGGSFLPFRMRANDIKAAVQRGAVFELPYAPALLYRKQRKALIQTCRELQVAGPGLKVRVIFSSGDRRYQMDSSESKTAPSSSSYSDARPLALRMPGDLVNLMRSVLHFDNRTSTAALTLHAEYALDRGRQRRFGTSGVSKVMIINRYSDLAEPQSKKARKEHNHACPENPIITKGSNKSKDDEKEESRLAAVDDGFIAL